MSRGVSCCGWTPTSLSCRRRHRHRTTSCDWGTRLSRPRRGPAPSKSARERRGTRHSWNSDWWRGRWSALYDRWPMVVKLSDRVDVEWFKQVSPIGEPGRRRDRGQRHCHNRRRPRHPAGRPTVHRGVHVCPVDKAAPLRQQQVACRLSGRLGSSDNLRPVVVHRQHRPQHTPHTGGGATST